MKERVLILSSNFCVFLIPYDTPIHELFVSSASISSCFAGLARSHCFVRMRNKYTLLQRVWFIYCSSKKGA